MTYEVIVNDLLVNYLADDENVKPSSIVSVTSSLFFTFVFLRHRLFFAFARARALIPDFLVSCTFDRPLLL